MRSNLLILGDSISLGALEVRGNEVIGRVESSYVDLLSLELLGVRIVVDADVHRTTADACKSIDALLTSHRPEVVLIMLGGNDADLDWKRFVLSNGTRIRSRLSVENYEKNLRKLVERVLACGAEPVLSDMPNHHFELRGPYVSKLAGVDVTAMLERGGGQAESDKSLALYREVVARIAADLPVAVVRYGELLDTRPPREMVGVDGTHPSAAAHRLIAEALTAPLLQAFKRTRTEHQVAVTGLTA